MVAWCVVNLVMEQVTSCENIISSNYYYRLPLIVISAPSRAFYGQGTGAIVLDNLQCTGSETRLVDCPHNGLNIHNCAHSEDAGVQCESKNQLSTASCNNSADKSIE